MPKKSIWRYCDVILANFCTKIYVIFYSGLSEKFRKNLRHIEKENSIFEPAKFFYNICPMWPFWATFVIFMFHLFSIRSTWNFEIFSDFQKVDLRKCRPYEAEYFRKVVSKQKTNLQKVSGTYVKRVKIWGEKTLWG